MTIRRDFCAFTLIELLTVIAILAVIAGILLPVLSSARQKAYAAQCANNLRGLAHATMLYVEDNDEFLPYAWISTSSDASLNNFHSLLQPYINDTEFDGYSDFTRHIFLCPTRSREPLVGVNPFRVSYGMNGFNSVSYPSHMTSRISEVEDTTETVLITDVNYTWNHPAITSPNTGQMGYKHVKKANVAFMDGHVGSYFPNQMSRFVLFF